MNIDLLQSPRRREWACLALPDLLSAGDLAGATGCFARNACLVTQDATAIHGRDHIRPALSQLIASGTRIDVGLSNVLVAGDVAWARERWTIYARGADDDRLEQTTSPLLVMQRIEKRWKLAIAVPWS
jgi:ketosteroid isomerase-like protein